jgi:hypothetical protein
MDQERAVSLEHEQPNRFWEASREAARVEHFTTGDDEAHGSRSALSVSDMAQN